jgi:antitoxin component YwqK of YwqJK toxin-antitoxin module
MQRSNSTHFEIVREDEHKFKKINGKINGLYEIIGRNSRTRSYYRDGKKHGPETIHKDGKLVFQCSYVDGKKHGLVQDGDREEYYINGKKVDKEEYLAY